MRWILQRETMSIMFAGGAEAPSANIMDMVSPYAPGFALWNATFVVAVLYFVLLDLLSGHYYSCSFQIREGFYHPVAGLVHMLTQ